MGAGAGLVAGITAAFAAADAATVAAIGVTLTTVFEVTTAVGVGLSVIGAVTGNQTLSKVGMGLGIVGGIDRSAGRGWGVRGERGIGCRWWCGGCARGSDAGRCDARRYRRRRGLAGAIRARRHD